MEDILSFLEDYNKAKERLVLRLENINRINMEDPHVEVSDLAITYVVKIDDIRGFRVTRSVLEHWRSNKYDVSHIYEDALSAAQENEPLLIQSLPNMLINMSDGECPQYDCNLYVVTTESMSMGAAALFYNSTIPKLRELTGVKDFAVIPSSIHEILIIPYESQSDIDASFINRTIETVNSMCVSEDDWLSDHGYLYSNNKFSELED